LEDASGPEMVCTYSVDPEQSPKRLDFTPRGETTPNVGIYDLKGDRLTFVSRKTDRREVARRNLRPQPTGG